MKLHSFGKIFSLVALLTLVFALTFAVSITVNAESAAQSEIKITVIRDENDNFAKTDPTLVSAEGKVKLDWDKPEGAVKYLIYRDGEHIVNSLSDHYVATLPLGVEVNFTVYAVDAAGNVLAVDSIDVTADHSWNITVVAPTCVDDGLATYVCKHCDETKEEVLSALGHTAGTPVKENNVDPTCTEKGGYDMVTYCTVCDTELGSVHTELAALGHTSAVDNAVAPTCTETGLTAGSHCSVCNATLVAQNVVPALGHKPVVDAAKAPNCTETGLTEGSHCSVCDTILVAQNVVPALGHTNGTPVKENNVDPTCTTAGGYDMATYCTVCEAETSRVHTDLAALGHTDGTPKKENNVNPTCTTKGGYDMATYCTVCKVETSRVHTELAALGHNEGAPKKENNVAPTCTTKGGYDMATYCTVCKVELDRVHTELAALGHNPGAAATCTTDQNCQTCNAVLEAAHGHDFHPNDDPKAVIVKQICKTCGTEGEFVKVQFPPAYTTYAIVGACVIVIIICLIALAAPATTTPWYKRRRR